MPERNFLISPPGSPPVGWEQTHEVSLAEDLQPALEQLRVRREQEDLRPSMMDHTDLYRDRHADGPDLFYSAC